MSYISLFVALLKMRGSELAGSAWWDAYLDQLVEVEEWFFAASWWVFGIVLVLAILFIVINVVSGTKTDIAVSLNCGCFAIFLLTLPLFEWITLLLAQGMAESVTPDGMINSGKFLISALLYVMLGTG